jgi:hypothetical protein
MGSVRYSEDRSPLRAELPERYEGFAQLWEGFLPDYGYNMARANWGDPGALERLVHEAGAGHHRAGQEELEEVFGLDAAAEVKREHHP